MSEPYDDFALVAECIGGKQEAWDIFVKRYSRLVNYSITKTLKLYSRYLQQEDVADIYNSIFLSFIENDYKKLRQFEGKHGCTLSSWVRLISIRYTIDFLRGQRQHISLNEEHDEKGPLIDTIPDNRMSVEEEIESRETERTVREAINGLSSSDKLFVRLYYEKELPPEEIANIMHVSISTIYSKKNRIGEKIKKILKEKGFVARNSE